MSLIGVMIILLGLQVRATGSNLVQVDWPPFPRVELLTAS